MTALLAWAWLFTLPGLVLTAFGLPGNRRQAGFASLLGPPLILVVALAALLTRAPDAEVAYANWLPFLADNAFRLRADALSALLLAVLGLVGTVVYVYSLGYMADDPSRRRFFVYLDLFLAAMSLLLLAGNLAVLLVGWTGVGISSFLLISFWRDRQGTLGAGLQALAANAIGDGALLLAASLVPTGCGSLVTLGTPDCTAGVGGAELLALLLVVAAAAKSAQGPLYFWLPSAMAGPTPISALIHAATMVAAGVYLLVRTHALIALAPQIGSWIAIVAVATALGASIMSLFQVNLKRGIAFSTVAQLGYMFAGIGIGVPFAGLFHLFTHAAFKALLFLCAGIVIHGEGGEERLAALSGRGRHYRMSRIGFWIGSLALIGVPFFSGAFSKDLLIEEGLRSATPWVGYALLGGALLTGLYTGRLLVRVYHAPESGLSSHEPHDPRGQEFMDWALVPLMVLAVFAGWAVYALPGWLNGLAGEAPTTFSLISTEGLAAFGLGLLGFVAAGWWQRRAVPTPIGAESAPFQLATWVRPIRDLGSALATSLAGAQSGHLPRYAFGSVVAVAVVLMLRVVAR